MLDHLLCRNMIPIFHHSMLAKCFIKSLSFNGILIFVLLFGCRVGPRYHPPVPEAPAEWKASSLSNEATPYFDYWWEIFNDETLNCLEQQAVENNPNLYVALERVVEARALAGVNKADLYPQISLNPSFSDTGQLFKLFLPPGLNFPNPTNIPDVFRVHQMQYNLLLNASYEVDLWGRIRGQYESAVYNAQAKLQDYYVSLLSLTTDLASHYFQLRSLDAQLDYLQQTIDTYKKDYQLIKARFDKGIISEVDVSNASLQLTNAQSNYEDTARQRVIEENAIAVLIGMIPSDFCIEHNPLEEAPPTIPAGVPASILGQRPDIAEAERNMAAEHVLIGVAYASFLPSLSLTGALGYSSPDFKQFLRWISRYWSFGADAGETVFDGGRNTSNLKAAWARYREASGTYQQQVLTAFQEVENALNNLEMQSKQAYFLAQSVQSSEKTYSLSSNRYNKGLVNYLEVVDSERAKLNVGLSFIVLQGARYISTVQLIKALGGSWAMCEESVCEESVDTSQ